MNRRILEKVRSLKFTKHQIGVFYYPSLYLGQPKDSASLKSKKSENQIIKESKDVEKKDEDVKKKATMKKEDLVKIDKKMEE